MRRRRIFYAVCAVILLAAELCIALFVRDTFVRPYLGDVLAVLLVHCALRVVFPARPRLLPLYVFLFACLIEAQQAIGLLDLLGLGHVRLLAVVLGSTFSWPDILCYFVGCAIAAALEGINYARHHKQGKPPRQTGRPAA